MVGIRLWRGCLCFVKESVLNWVSGPMQFKLALFKGQPYVKNLNSHTFWFHNFTIRKVLVSFLKLYALIMGNDIHSKFWILQSSLSKLPQLATHNIYICSKISFHSLDNEIRSSDVNGISILRLDISIINISISLFHQINCRNSVRFASTITPLSSPL